MITLSEYQDIEHLEENRKVFLEAHAITGTIELDLGKVEQIDGAGAQLILSFLKEEEENCKEVKLNNFSPAVKEAFRLLGIEQS